MNAVSHKLKRSRFIIFLLILGAILLSLTGGVSSVSAASKKSNAKYTLRRVSCKKKYTIYLGDSKKLKVAYKNGTTKKKIVWKSSNSAVVQVKASSTGKTCKIKAKSVGKAVITCYPKGRPGKRLTCTITVKKMAPKIKSLSFKEKTIEVYIGDQVQNRLKIKPAGANKTRIKYSSSKKTVAKVNAKGVVTGLKAGTAKITVKSTDGSNKKTTYKVKVRMISFAKSSVSMYIGDTYKNTLKNQVTRSGAPGIKWSTSDPSVATVDAAGMVKAVGKGSAIITATINNKKGANTSFMVNVSYRITNESTKFIAHRGLSSEAPENTLRAFELAGQAGFWGAETDIRKTSDGRFILLHDATFQRMCGVNMKPEDMTFDEIRQLKITAGNNYALYKDDMLATTVPSLEEYLQCCLKYNMVPVIEIKMSYSRDGSGDQPDPGQADEDGDQISEGHLVDGQILQDMEVEDMQNLYQITRGIMGVRPYIFIDFDHITLMKMNEVLKLEYRSNIALQYISRTYDSETRTICEENGFEYDLKYQGVTQTGINQIRKNGGKVNLWTVDNRDKAEDYILNGIDYITTNKRFW